MGDCPAAPRQHAQCRRTCRSRAEDATAPREGKEIHLSITKGSKGVTWSSFLHGHTNVDAFTQQEVQKSMMLERFQAENPGFDFSGASFNGQVPDPKTFMDGVRYT